MAAAEADMSLKGDRDRFVAFAFASADVLIELDEQGRILFVDGATLGLLGRSSAQMAGEAFLDLVHEDSLEKTENVFAGLSHMARIDHVEIHLKHAENPETFVKVNLSGFRMPGMNEHTYLSLAVPRENVADEREVFRRDLSSGLLKKDSFVEDANKKIKEAQNAGKDVKLTLLDLPELKTLLDAMAPQIAASLMAEISAYLRSKSLDGDTAGILDDGAYSLVHDASVSDEQLLSELIDITKKGDPKGMGTQAIATTIAADNKRLTAQDSANALLYTVNKFATERGENFSLHSLSQAYGDMLEETVDHIAHFKDTVEFKKFEIAFQPIVDIKNGIIHHYECLVRLHDSEKFANPFQFISFGEKANLIADFDLAMMDCTLDTLEEASKQGNFPVLAVNLSGRSLSSNLFMDSFKKLMRQRPIPSKQVIIEITESSKINDFAIVDTFIQELKAEFGSLFCLDDFGTGESSFDYLRNIQVDFIKIDGSYVRESMKTLRGRQMLRAMAGLCSSIGIQAIGEMVEDEKSAGLLYDCGVRFGQGYLFGKPVVDTKTLLHFGKPTPYFRSTVRARRFRNPNKPEKLWWERKEG